MCGCYAGTWAQILAKRLPIFIPPVPTITPVRTAASAGLTGTAAVAAGDLHLGLVTATMLMPAAEPGLVGVMLVPRAGLVLVPRAGLVGVVPAARAGLVGVVLVPGILDVLA